jgi:ribosomal protein L16 Arg81 hydroxylase
VSNILPLLASLLAPVAIQDFFDDYWEAKPLHVGRRNTENYRKILRREDVDQYLSRKDLRYPALRMAKEGPTISADTYSSVLKFGSYASEGLINTAKVKSLYATGATIILQMTRSSIPRLALFGNQLHKELGFNVETTVYLTPANSQGFTTHYDTHSVFVLQIEGSKRWRIYDVLQELPTLDQTFDPSKTKIGPIRSEVILNPGDFLYVPRGVGHDAVTDGQGSLHVTVGLFPPLWIDLIARFFGDCKSDVQFRRSPVAKLRLPDGREEANADLLSLFSKMTPRFDVAKLVANHAEECKGKQTQANGGRLIDALHLDALSLDTTVALRKEIDCSFQRLNGRIVLSFYGKTVAFPESASPAISRILSGELTTIRELQTNLSDSSKLVLARKLVQEGLLTTQAIDSNSKK